MALSRAKEKASRASIACDFRAIDILREKMETDPFNFVFDRGCFHSFSTEKDRRTFARNVAAYLEDGGLWLTIAGNADEHRQGSGPPQLTAADIVLAVEPFFMILSLTSGYFGSNSSNPPRAWRCLMQKRQA